MAARSIVRNLGLLVAVGIVGAIAVVAYRSRAADASNAPILGVVHATEIRLAPETSGRLAEIRVKPGDRVRKGDVLAVLNNPELRASLEEARANAAAARARKLNVDAGVRKEKVVAVAENVGIAEANVVLARQQHDRATALAAKSFVSRQQLDEAANALAKAQASLDLARATYAQSQAGPTGDERAIAAAEAALADATVQDVTAKLAKTTLVAPIDAVVGLVVAEPGEAINPGQAVLTLDEEKARWFTFTIREDRLKGIAMGVPVDLKTAKGESVAARVTELRPLGEFAVWRAARAVGDHDLNSFLVRADPVGASSLEPGMTVWLNDAEVATPDPALGTERRN